MHRDLHAMLRVGVCGVVVVAALNGSPAVSAALGHSQNSAATVLAASEGNRMKPHAGGAITPASLGRRPSATQPPRSDFSRPAAVSRPAVAVLLFITAAVLFVIGRWGSRNLHSLAPTAYSQEGRQRRQRTMRRSVITCQVVGVVLALLAVFVLVGS